jgi:hypothetical protein
MVTQSRQQHFHPYKLLFPDNSFYFLHLNRSELVYY